MITLIPAIDLIDGRCVRLTKGDYATQKTYDQDPLEIAKAVEANGFTRLHLVDLDGAREGRVINLRTLERIATHTRLEVDFGGGIKHDDDLRRAADAGARMFTIGSIAVKDPERFLAWLRTYGGDALILGADVREGRVAISGWTEESSEALLPFIGRYVSEGVRRVLCTDISRDGMLQGPAIDLYRSVLDAQPGLHLIASGGVSSLSDLLALDEAGIPAVVFGKALYEGRFTLEELSRLL